MTKDFVGLTFILTKTKSLEALGAGEGYDLICYRDLLGLKGAGAKMETEKANRRIQGNHGKTRYYIWTMLNLRYSLVIQMDVGQQATRYTSLESRVQGCTPDINLGVFRVYRIFLSMIWPERTLGGNKEEEIAWD